MLTEQSVGNLLNTPSAPALKHLALLCVFFACRCCLMLFVLLVVFCFLRDSLSSNTQHCDLFLFVVVLVALLFDVVCHRCCVSII